MFEDYREDARQTIHRAIFEAKRSNSTEVDACHILLGLLADPILTAKLHLDGAETIRDQIRLFFGHGTGQDRSVNVTLGIEAKRVLALAREEADTSLDRHVDNRHIVLGVLRSNETNAALVLSQNGLSEHHVRAQLMLDNKNRGPSERLPQKPNSESEAVKSAVRKAIELARVRKHREALNLLEQTMAEHVDPHSIGALCSIAIVLSRSIGDMVLAESYCERLLALNPEDPLTLYELADSLALQGETDKARKCAEKSYQLILLHRNPQDEGLLNILKERFPGLVPEM